MLRLPTLDAGPLFGRMAARADVAQAGPLRADPAHAGTQAASVADCGMATQTALDALGTAIAAHLAEDGACWIAHWPPPELRARLHHDLLRLQSAEALAEAAVGRGGARRARHDIRGDRTCWLDDPRCGPAAVEFSTALDRIRAAIDREAFLGLAEFEAHYAIYPPGTGYARHRDRFRDSDARVVSWVSYLNPEWGDDDGGALRLYADDGRGGEHAIDRMPFGGSICFLSELEHEVLAARRQRHSIAGWMRRHAYAPLAHVRPNA